MTSRDSEKSSATQHHLAGEGGVVAPMINDRDPYEVLDELMVVVEALCPRWPPREIFSHTDKMLL